MSIVEKVRIIDSHTAGEPTRVVVEGGPQITIKGAKQVRDFLNKSADWLRCALIHEPRGFEAMVGAFLCEPADETCVAGVVFFNNTGYLNGCLHGSMGVIETLAHLGKISPGCHRLETPVGVITAELDEEGFVTISNVPSYRLRTGVSLEVPGYGKVRGDVAWGGNWFFLVDQQGPAIGAKNIEKLTDFAKSIREALDASDIRGAGDAIIDHVELFSAPESGVSADSQNFVLCPGQAYDRSPCGTGTSAKLACLAASGQLKEEEVYLQAGILGTAFEGRYQRLDEQRITPIVRGRAFVTAEGELILREDDPYRYGVECK